ncbi:DUF1015 domain-containing protein [Sphaerisporangium sp. TRM90804]|uniref:DUF1015 domain-containing protein n=1 Tax=Sphaerisporangium sp. TRM90804 TaxID=3031113 RepID=UPI00244BF555|nr:DUF1015 domain-containing protein [Sphaerisporangium sp. TRM90804]MDH2430305.1 DUF1015 domain-containing protein [Sphaerisporangium sp. TRM90804]
MAIPELPSPDGLVLRPFHAVRFTVDDRAAVTSPPYDLIAPEDVQALLDAHPNNVVRLILPGADRRHYAQARETLLSWRSEGVLATDELPALYVYEQRGPGILIRGLIGDLGLSDPRDGVIMPHEDVMPATVADRLALMRTTESNLEPIFLLYEGAGGIARLIEEVASNRSPLVDVRTGDGIGHRLWALTEPAEQDMIAGELRERRALIADGHHRYATYLALQREYHAEGRGPGPWDYGLALLVDSTAYPPDLKAIHRVIPGLSLEEAVARSKGAWRVHEYPEEEAALAALAEATGPAFVLAGEGPSHLLTDPDPVQVNHAMPTSRSERWNSLATSILSEFLLPKVWGMHDDEQTVQIVHHDARLAIRRARAQSGTAVIVPPLAVQDVLAVAAEGERVPRKSTSFGPKPRTGLLLRTFADD